MGGCVEVVEHFITPSSPHQLGCAGVESFYEDFHGFTNVHGSGAYFFGGETNFLSRGMYSCADCLGDLGAAHQCLFVIV